MNMQMNKRPHPKNPPSKKIANEIKLSVIGYYTTLALRLLGALGSSQTAVHWPPRIQINDIALSDPRLVENSGSWFVIRGS